MSEFEKFFQETFEGLERLAPGSEASTLKALGLVQSRLEPKRILDIGCGTGSHTIALARNTQAEIIALDSNPAYLTAVEGLARHEGFSDRVRTLEASMLELDGKCERESFDLIWAEGSIYIIGFDKGLKVWRDLLSDDGILACSELAWLSEKPSKAAREFWGDAYPAMRSGQSNVKAAQSAGYEVLDQFTLPASDWTEAYYGPLEARVTQQRTKHVGDGMAQGVFDIIQAEIDLYKKAGRDYGYVFYILRKRAKA